jgi:NitT/TauT family transport system ATP-binding protein
LPCPPASSPSTARATEERERYGATVTNDIAIWPPRVAGRKTIYDADVEPGQDDLIRFAITAGTTRPAAGGQP